MKYLLLSLLFLSLISCTSPTNNRNSDNNTVTVLCRCKEGYTSWSGPDQASAEDRAKRNCESINGSAHDCKVIN